MASNLQTPFLPTTRREFFRRAGRGIGLLAFSRFAPSFLVNAALGAAPAPEQDRRILVVIQLAGGNDGLNTLVPFTDANYYRLRPTLGIRPEQVLRLNDDLGLHPACGPLAALFKEGKLAIAQNVGYPNPNHSHFRSTEIWETASASGEFISTGWIGRYLDNACAGRPAASHDPLAIHVNALNGEPESFLGASEHPTFGLLPHAGSGRDSEETRKLLEAISGGTAGSASPGLRRDPSPAVGLRGAETEKGFLQHTLMDALVTESRVQQVLGSYRPAAPYPANPFGASLQNVAALIASRLPTRVYFVTLNGFDTHVNQLDTQARLLGTLSAGLAAFQSDLEAHRLDDQVVTMTFSEFGRRPNENESRGTDHGTTAPLFVMGRRVRGGLHGTTPALALPKNQDLASTTDFRGIYATMLEDWLSAPSAPVLNGTFAKLPLIA